MASNVGWLFFAPTAMALFARAAPPSVNAQMIGVYYLSIFGGSLLSGRLGVLYERIEPQAFWLLHAAIAGAGGLFLLLIGNRLSRKLRLGPGTPSHARAIQVPAGGTREAESP
jgi:POT family proton-dependent oligopeptide transporter